MKLLAGRDMMLAGRDMVLAGRCTALQQVLPARAIRCATMVSAWMRA